jgi:hypothetical protein
MSYEVYKVIHILGLLLLFQALGASVILGNAPKGTAWKRATSIAHGLGLLFMLVAGFGMLARLGLTAGFPGWVWAKLAIWVVLGAAPFVAAKLPSGARILWGASVGLGFLAAFVAIYKPF